MLKRTGKVVVVVSVLVASASVAQERTPVDATAAPALAERFIELAQRTLRAGKTITPGQWDSAVALLRASAKLNSNEPRVYRLLTEAGRSADDQTATIEALKNWRRLDANNPVPQVRMIDIYVSQMESVDARLGYYVGLSGRAGVAEEVRAYCALRGAQLATERGQAARSKQLLDLALRLDPYNAEALRLNAAGFQDGTPYERVAALWAILRANPAQPDTIVGVADIFSDAGMSTEAIEWYGLAFGQLTRVGRVPEVDSVISLVSQLMQTDQLAGADNLIQQMLAVPGAGQEPDLWFMRLLIDKAGGDKVKFDNSRRAAMNVLFNRLQNARAATGAGGATTRPIDAGGVASVPDLSDEARKLASGADARLKADYLSAATDLAMFQIYFDRDPATAEPLLEAIRLIAPVGDTTFTRLQGWSFYVGGKTDEARVKFSALAEQNPLSALGLFLLDDKNPAAPLSPELESRARGLRGSHPSGLVGATLWEALRGRKVRLTESPDATAIRQNLQRFPKDLLRAPLQPEQFYVLRADPVKTSHAFGEPMLATITITNSSAFPITVGPNGLIKPDAWFDAQWRGLAKQTFPGVAVDKFSGAGVLQPRQSTGFVVRLDQGLLADALRANPQVALQLSGSVMTNPVGVGDGSVGPGPGGYRVQFTRLMERVAYPAGTDEQRKALIGAVKTGTVAQRLGALELLRTYVNLLGSANPDPKSAEVSGDFAKILDEATTDPSPAVRAWAGLLSSDLIKDRAAQKARLGTLAADPAWEVRLASLTAAVSLDAESKQTFAAKFTGESEPEPIVRAYANAVIQAAKEQPAPTTAPTTTRPD